MLSSFNCLYLFENRQIFILEIKRNNQPADAIKSDTYKWLLLEKETLSITELVFLSSSSIDVSEERFFRQGYLSFDSDQAIYIRESSSIQNVLESRAIGDLPVRVTIAVNQWLKKIDGEPVLG